jgi:hypothetical protein
MFAVGFV